MKQYLIIIMLASIPSVGFAQPLSWRDYVVPESGAVAQIPTTIFYEDGGKPEEGYGRRFLTLDGRANLTVQAVSNDAGDSPGAF